MSNDLLITAAILSFSPARHTVQANHVTNANMLLALTLLVGRQEGHPACKKTEWWDVGVVVWDEVQTCI